MMRVVKKPEVRRADIVGAARSLFGANGFDGTTMHDIVQELNVAKGTIYHYFKSKEELLEAVINDIADEATERMERAADETTGDALAKLRALISAARVADDHQELMQQLHRSANAGMHARLLAVVLQRQAPLYAKLFQQGRDEGLFQFAASPLETAEFILTSIQFLTDEGIFPWAGETLLRRVQAFPSLVEKQLGARPGSFDFLFPQM